MWMAPEIDPVLTSSSLRTSIVRRAIERDHPGWRPEQGRCAEVYEALLPTPG
jgi:hypothetical protein